MSAELCFLKNKHQFNFLCCTCIYLMFIEQNKIYVSDYASNYCTILAEYLIKLVKQVMRYDSLQFGQLDDDISRSF